ncbi:MAG TPA: DUF86 domain-containing protein [Longimicrobium sp.]|nr:DUF86 domain-containing protein [Longimicrobium sp.]
MLREDEIRILHIVEACEAVLRYVSGQRQEDLQADDMRARAVIQAIGVIGEAAAHLSAGFQTQHADIPWPKIVGMRNRLVHAYFDIDYKRLWDTATSDVPALLARMKSLLGNEAPGS